MAQLMIGIKYADHCASNCKVLLCLLRFIISENRNLFNLVRQFTVYKLTVTHRGVSDSEFRSCVKVEVAILGSPS